MTPNIKIYTPHDSQVVLLKLAREGSTVNLVACDSTGKQITEGILLTITDTGHFISQKNVNPALGLPLDGNGRVKFHS